MTVVAMVVHTKSPFLTLMGLFQIVLSFPLAYFVYYFVCGLVFFPFLNFIGIFVVFALGAGEFDDMRRVSHFFNRTLSLLTSMMSFRVHRPTLPPSKTTSSWPWTSGRAPDTSCPTAPPSRWPP